jgi:energy-coupling factor transporter ATP-binding protein EcfA2
VAGEPLNPGGSPAPVLVLEDADLAPPGRTAPLLREVHLELLAGETAVLLGGNGSGKTTLLRSAAGLWPLQRGSRRVPSARDYDAGQVGLVLEDPSSQFVAGTIREELEFILENRGWEGHEIEARVDHSLSRYDLLPLQGRDPRRLSPGEQERCLLAAATLLEPRLLLLDDAFLYLGPGEALPIWRNLVRETRSQGRNGVLLACHDAELAVYADRVGVLQDGGLAFWGAPETVLRSDLPAAVEPALGVWLERTLRSLDWDVPGTALDPEGLAGRLGEELRA